MSNEEIKKIIEKEIVERVDVVKAYIVLYNQMINNSNDCMLFCSAINLLNTFVKQEKKVISYSFKSRLFFLLDILSMKKIDNVKLSYSKKKDESLLIIQIGEIQFSYHGIIIKDDLLKTLECYIFDLKWDQIRKQNVSVTLFNEALNDNLITKEAKDYRLLKDIIDQAVEEYKKGEILLSKNGPVYLNGNFV